MRLFRGYFIAAALSCMVVAGCASTGSSGPPGGSSGPVDPGNGPSPPMVDSPLSALSPVLAPLAGSHVDDEAIRAAWKTADAALYVVDFMVSFGWLEPGSPKALEVADTAEAVRRWLNAATAAQQAGQQPTADAAFAQAGAAYVALRRALEK